VEEVDVAAAVGHEVLIGSVVLERGVGDHVAQARDPGGLFCKRSKERKSKRA
jgi:hypothetical protein